jgi:NOL1/NOP2/fmu family ribosome biogenesis protein
MSRSVALLLGVLAVIGESEACLGQGLEEAASTFAEQWARGRTGAMQDQLASGGVRIQWQGRPLGTLDPRHAGASIREYLGGREAVAARVSRVEEVGGDPPKGYAEIRWESRVMGTSEVVTRTIFVAFVTEGGTWRVTELRVLP